MSRITARNLEALVRTLNLAMGTPAEKTINTPGKPPHFSLGNYHIEADASGYTLAQITGDGGSTSFVAFGRKPADLYEFMQGAVWGARTLKQRDEASPLKAKALSFVESLDNASPPDLRAADKALTDVVSDPGIAGTMRNVARIIRNALRDIK